MTTEAGRLPYCIPESEWCDGHNRHLRVCYAEASEARAALPEGWCGHDDHAIEMLVAALAREAEARAALLAELEAALGEHYPVVGGWCESGLYGQCSCGEWDAMFDDGETFAAHVLDLIRKAGA